MTFLLLAIAISIVLSPIVAFTANVQGMTKYIGHRINPSIGSNIQNAITPKAQTTRNLLLPILFLAPILLAIVEGWAWVIAVTIFHIVLIAINYRLLGRSANRYLNYIGADLTKRHADYLKENDKVRAEVAQEYIQDIASICEDVIPKNYSVEELVSKP